MLSRANELERLKAAQGALHGKLNEAAQQAEAAQREMQKAEYELQVAKDQQRKAADEVLTLQGRQDHYDLLLESLRLSCETMEQELSGLDRRETDGRGRMAGIQADITAAEDRAAALRQEMRDKLAGQTDLTEQTNQLAQAVSDRLIWYPTALSATGGCRSTGRPTRRRWPIWRAIRRRWRRRTPV